jgi:hypothetical protein
VRPHHGSGPATPGRVRLPVKKIRFEPNVAEEVRAIEQRVALNILTAIHRYAATGAGRVKPLSGEFEGLLRLRVGSHRVIFGDGRHYHRPPGTRSPRRLPVTRTILGGAPVERLHD